MLQALSAHPQCHTSSDNTPSWDHVFKYTSLWDTFLVHTTPFAPCDLSQMLIRAATA